MFRLVKVLNAHNQAEVKLVNRNSRISITPGCALTCTNGIASTPSTSDSPEYIALANNYYSNPNKVGGMLVTENMVFKVEYIGNVTPIIGMSVGLASGGDTVDSVTYNSSGKGTIIGLDDDKRFVYVRFRK